MNPKPLQPKITTLETKQLIGQHLTMSIANNRTAELWKSFAPRIREILHRKTTDKISMQCYDAGYFQNFQPTRTFEKWAAVTVDEVTEIPQGMEAFDLPGGLYAVFEYKGSSADRSIFHYIFEVWLPQSDYRLDHRPHFEVLGDKYRNKDPESEEEIWIPIVGK